MQDKVRTDLNSAREIYQSEVSNIKTIVRLTAERFYIKDALIKKDYDKLYSEITTVRKRETLDFLTLLDEKGRVIVRPRNTLLIGDDQTWSEIVRNALARKDSFAALPIKLLLLPIKLRYAQPKQCSRKQKIIDTRGYQHKYNKNPIFCLTSDINLVIYIL
ncbi:MAG: hypothetical protein AB1599_02130 [Planctomycetota bacterium]